MEPLGYGREALVVLGAYSLGCFATGYYLVRWWTGEDVRSYGSGSVGATNVGRLIGRPGFLLTLLVDSLKGTLAVWIADYFHLNATGVVLAMVAVVAGHVWPVQLRFRGGKGVATCLGALVLYDPVMTLVFAALFAGLFLAIRNMVLAGMVAFAVLPFVVFGLDRPLDSVFGVSAIAVIILIAHRRNIPEEISKWMAERKAKDSKQPAHPYPKR